jgi:hypothetical protein
LDVSQDEPGVKLYEETLQMLLNQQMDEHELMSTALSQGLSTNGFDHSYKGKSKSKESNVANFAKIYEVLAEQLLWPGRSVHTLRSQRGNRGDTGTLKWLYWTVRKFEGHLFPKQSDLWSDGKGDDEEDNLETRSRFCLESLFCLRADLENDSSSDEDDEEGEVAGGVAVQLIPKK